MEFFAYISLFGLIIWAFVELLPKFIGRFIDRK